MLDNKEGSRRIAKNTLVLFGRMMFITLLSLYISRLILAALGPADFGIYNVVGGVVVLLAFLNNAMTNASQRFLSFELGTGNQENVKKVFQNSLVIHLLLVLLILFLAETVGLWFVNTQLNIPPERMPAARFVYQFSILTFLISVMHVPFRATLIAHERMGTYAVVSIAEVVFKLIVALMLPLIGFDSLKLYSILIALVSFLVLLLYIWFTIRRYDEVSLRLKWHPSLLREMSFYAGWSIFGSFASVTYQQGINILLNIFFNVVINAARAITMQLSVALNSLIASFQTAVNPQIVKSYASGDRPYMFSLIFNSSKFSYFVLFVSSLPFLFEMDTLLDFWLKEVPVYTAIFSQLVIIDLLINSLSNPLMIAAHATGKIRNYQLVVGGILLLNLPVSWLFLEYGAEPQVTFMISIGLSLLSLVSRIFMLKQMIELNTFRFIKEVILPVLRVTVISVILMIFADRLIDSPVLIIVVAFAIAVLVVYVSGLRSEERKQVVGVIKEFWR